MSNHCCDTYVSYVIVVLLENELAHFQVELLYNPFKLADTLDYYTSEIFRLLQEKDILDTLKFHSGICGCDEGKGVSDRIHGTVYRV